MEPPSTSSITILNESGKRLRLEPMRRAAIVALKRHGRERAAINVLLTGDDEIRTLNRQFRNVDEPTDVLSFPTGRVSAKVFPNSTLGDIAISVPYATRQAAARKVSLTQELAYLLIHGTLHLVGFDDVTPKKRAAMVAEMNEVALAAGLKPDREWFSLLHKESASK